MPFVKRAVFDTSSLVGAVLRPASVPRRALMLAVARMQLCASPFTLRELEEVIARPVFDRYLDAAARHEFVALYRRHARIFEVQPDEESRLTRSCRDPRDNKFLALAIVASADVIVSSDDDLLTMTPYQQISILKPTDFILTHG